MLPVFFRTRSFVATVAISGALLLIAGCGTSERGDNDSVATAAPTFVGNEACADCHQSETAKWLGSHHDHAFEVATLANVLGDFNNADFTYAGVTSSFFVRDGRPWVRTDAADGSLQEYPVTHTIGITPLQQYLIEMPRGHFQVLSIAWDTRPEDDGGQRWFHLYPDEAIDSDDPLHWTGTYQSWNTMCAECHSTNLIKGYDVGSDQFETVWSRIDVGCEACHGPGSNHVEDPAVFPPALAMTERTWTFADGAVVASLAPGSTRSNEIEVCAQCHARRTQVSDDFEPGDAFLDAYRPALLDEGLYHADGQTLDEVYVYGSFLQSAMAGAGVTCSDCHDPHSNEVRAPGNALCGQCHVASFFDTPEHHRHEAGAELQCVDCHMRTETYMVVDPRRDHSFRVPRPDLSTKLGSPNACNDCHLDESAEWAAARVNEWYPQGRQTEFHYGEAIHAGRTWAADASALLRRVIEDESQPEIVRATAISLVVNQPGAAFDLIAAAASSPDPLVQLAAIDAAQILPPRQRVDAIQRYLTGPLKSQRVAAARALSPVRDELSQSRQQDLDAALTEYIGVQRLNGDRGEGLMNEASLAAELGRLDEAEAGYRLSLEREPDFSASYVNLADVYRSQGRESEAEDVLRAGIANNPDDPSLHLALGLSLVRSGREADALAALAVAVAAAPDEPYYAYVYAVALNSTGDTAMAIETLRATHDRFPGHSDTLFALTTMLRDAGQVDDALEHARLLEALVPTDQGVRGLVQQLETAAGNQ